jgi:hypothetical protein
LDARTSERQGDDDEAQHASNKQNIIETPCATGRAFFLCIGKHIKDSDMIQSSLKSGQKALQPLPSKSVSDKRNLQSYPVAEALLQDRQSLKSDEEAGIEVLKVTKVSKSYL